MFGLGKLEVLESKLSIYEDLSKEMLDKLERAVSSIQESSNKVAIILERQRIVWMKEKRHLMLP